MLKYLQIIIGLVLCCAIASFAHGQNELGSTADRSAIQAYLDQQNQFSGPFESMARMQVEVLYGDFLDSLGGDESHRLKAEEVLIEIIAERAEMSSQASSGRATPEQLREVSSYDYLRERMEAVLNSAELQILDSRQEGMAEEQLRKNYLEQLTRISPEVTKTNQAIVLNVLVEHMLFQENDSSERNQITAEELVQQQLLSLLEARVQLQDMLEGEQLEMVNSYLNELRSNLFLNQSMSRN
ncbi:MAG: hypothetical protein OXU66_09230 [Gammaproteobacteria bacterium]|nr:hypothetical protein [Gammaproteobacteria bacterium]MDD9896263.1 hypothetical protein [Gammaproteobacteria bacterium]MDD9959112.1 hypothetical protein [Gammaproteobacteria bacterium]